MYIRYSFLKALKCIKSGTKLNRCLVLILTSTACLNSLRWVKLPKLLCNLQNISLPSTSQWSCISVDLQAMGTD